MAGVASGVYLESLKNGNFSDFTIVCKDVEFKVHRLVVCGASPMLKAACCGGFEEAISGKIDFSEEEPEIMARTLLFMYTGDYDDTSKKESESSKLLGLQVFMDDLVFKKLETNALVYKCADMLGVEDLKALAADRFVTDARTVFTKRAFAEPLRIMYESTRSDDGYLRLPITTLCIKHHNLLADIPETIAVIQHYEYNVWTVHMALLKEISHGKAQERKIMEEVVALVNANDKCPCCKKEQIRYSVESDVSVVAHCSGMFCKSQKIFLKL